jgi:hypothetical protein
VHARGALLFRLAGLVLHRALRRQRAGEVRAEGGLDDLRLFRRDEERRAIQAREETRIRHRGSLQVRPRA